jgi:hypothetical protein
MLSAFTHSGPVRPYRLVAASALLVLLSCSAILAQETRGTILGTVRDSSGAVVPGATVTVTNTGTNLSNNAVSNESGAFEVPYLTPGTYTVSATAQGFKKFVQQGVIVNVGGRANVDVILEVGAVTEEVVITGTAPLLDTTSGSGSAVLDNRAVRSLPVFGGSAILTLRSLPGIQWTGQPNYLGLHSNIGGSQISAAGGAGGTEFVLDGIPNGGLNRRAAFLPYTDAVEEVRVSSSEFDASEGHTAGATVNMVTKSGTNQYHGTLNWLHWQQRFNGTPSFTKAAYFQRINAAEASGNTALAEQLRAQPRQPTGHSNTYAATIGGPIKLPRFGEGGPVLWSGQDKLFFFFAYNGYKEVKPEEVTAINRTVPTAAHRRGDFSDLLRLGPQYQIYDPRTARLEGGRVVRDPFPNNQVPILNPIYNAIVSLYPLPNGNPASADGYTNNYLASGTPFNWDYTAYQNRIDFNVSPRQKLTGKWSYNKFLEDRGDWTYETARGLNSNGLVRRNTGIGLDYVLTLNSTTFLRFTAAYNRFIEGNQLNSTQTSFSPSSIGLPSYIDQRAGGLTRLPDINFSAYSNLSGAYPGFTRVSAATTAGEMSKTFSRHTLRAGYDIRQNYRAANGPGQTSGQFQFRNNYVRPRDDNFGNPAAIGLEWAAFMLGVPTSIVVDRNDTLYLTNPFAGFYVQDDWRVSPRLTLNLGFRYEIEGGFRERFNRGIGQFDPNIELPISAAAEAAYARNPIPQVPVSQFDVRGGSQYLGVGGAPRTLNDAQPAYMPRIGFAYQWNPKTVVRGGYGLFYDTNNVLNWGLDQFGFSRSTSTTITNNNGLTFENTNLTSPGCRTNPSACQTILSDPFPLRSDGTRFNEPFGSALGIMARAGRGFSYVNRDWKRARQQRWRFGIQRELRSNMVLEVAYLGSYTDNITTVTDNPGDNQTARRLDVLPQQYWSTGLVRNQANADFLNALVPNPFNIANFTFLQTQNPLLYQDMSTNSFFTSTTIRRHQLLRPFPLYSSGLNILRVPEVTLKYHHLETSLTQRFSQGASFTISYQWASSQVKDFLQNEFDTERVYRQNTNYRPHSFRANGVIDLPFGKGRRFFSEGGFLSSLLGGWQVAPIYYLQSGRVYDFGNVFFYGNTKDIKLPDSERTRERWFNWQLFPGATRDYRPDLDATGRNPWRERIRQIVPASIIAQLPPRMVGGRLVPASYDNVTPTDFQPADFQARVFPSRFNWLRGDIMSQLDMSVTRNFPITENTRFEFRTDFINALNSVQWDNPDTNVTSGNFGSVTQQYNTPRWIQFQLRFVF